MKHLEKLQELVSKAKEVGVNENVVVGAYYRAYELHKKAFGSFRNVDNYAKRMEERYNFMYNRGLVEIESLRMEKKYGFRAVIPEVAGLSTCCMEDGE